MDAVAAANSTGEAPKLENFLGNQTTHYTDGGVSEINVNVAPPNSYGGSLNFAGKDALPNYHHQYSQLLSQHPPYHYTFTPQTLSPHGPSITSVSGLKSWLRQAGPPYKSAAEESAAGCSYQSGQSLSLTMSPTSSGSSGAVIVGGSVSIPAPTEYDQSGISNSKRVVPVTARESFPRKSIDTFGQRTSQYRGVTR